MVHCTGASRLLTLLLLLMATLGLSSPSGGSLPYDVIVFTSPQAMYLSEGAPQKARSVSTRKDGVTFTMPFSRAEDDDYDYGDEESDDDDDDDGDIVPLERLVFHNAVVRVGCGLGFRRCGGDRCCRLSAPPRLSCPPPLLPVGELCV